MGLGIRAKLLDFKRRLSDRRMYSIVIVVTSLITLWGLYQYKTTMELRQQLDSQYNRAFYDLLSYNHNVSTLLGKALLTSTPEAAASTYADVWRQAGLAQTNLNQLPVSHPTLDKTSKFLMQVGDYAYAISTQSIGKKAISDQQYAEVTGLYSTAKTIEDSLNMLAGELGAGRLKWGELQEKAPLLMADQSKNIGMQDFEGLEKQVQQIPSLIYDGPFSDHISDLKAKNINGDPINSEAAATVASNFLGGQNVTGAKVMGESVSGTIPVYNVEVTTNGMNQGDKINMQVTKTGGHMLWMLDTRGDGAIAAGTGAGSGTGISASTGASAGMGAGAEEAVPAADMNANSASGGAPLDMAMAREKATQFLSAKGCKNMIPTYYLNEGNIATINFAYQQDKVVVYPDLIKVQVAMSSGEIVGFESKAYLTNHTERNIPSPKVSSAKARASLNPRLNIVSSGLAIIPTEWKTEVLCHEFKGKLNDTEFIIYVNALTGSEEKILMIVNTPNGSLSM